VLYFVTGTNYLKRINKFIDVLRVANSLTLSRIRGLKVLSICPHERFRVPGTKVPNNTRLTNGLQKKIPENFRDCFLNIQMTKNDSD
jgi:hypothetical protein